MARGSRTFAFHSDDAVIRVAALGDNRFLYELIKPSQLMFDPSIMLLNARRMAITCIRKRMSRYRSRQAT